MVTTLGTVSLSLQRDLIFCFVYGVKWRYFAANSMDSTKPSDRIYLHFRFKVKFKQNRNTKKKESLKRLRFMVYLPVQRQAIGQIWDKFQQSVLKSGGWAGVFTLCPAWDYSSYSIAEVPSFPEVTHLAWSQSRTLKKSVEHHYNDIGLYDTPSITSDILWYQLIPHC
jgi:hypothetical protein